MFGRLLLTGFLALTCAAAQDEMGGGMGGRGGGMGSRGGGDMGGSMGAGARRATKVEQAVDKLKLTNEQKGEFGKIFSAAGERAGSVRAELDKARADLAGAMIDGKPAEDVARLTANVAAISAKMTKIEADAWAQVYAFLKPNQQSKFDQAYELLAGVFSGPARSQAGRGGGRGRGEGR